MCAMILKRYAHFTWHYLIPSVEIVAITLEFDQHVVTSVIYAEECFQIWREKYTKIYFLIIKWAVLTKWTGMLLLLSPCFLLTCNFRKKCINSIHWYASAVTCFWPRGIDSLEVHQFIMKWKLQTIYVSHIVDTISEENWKHQQKWLPELVTRHTKILEVITWMKTKFHLSIHSR